MVEAEGAPEPAAAVGVLDIVKGEARYALQQGARLVLDLLGLSQMTGIVVGDGLFHAQQGRAHLYLIDQEFGKIVYLHRKLRAVVLFQR